MRAKGTTALFLMSFLGIFAELSLIRYIPSNVYLLSYYKNAILIAAFLGFGTGFLASRGRRTLIAYSPFATLVVVAAVLFFNDFFRIDLDYASLDESLWPEFWANTRARAVPMLPALLFFFTLTSLYFVPFGQETARLMEGMAPLRAYSVNIAGSLAGILAFSAAGWMWTKPILWFSVILLPLLIRGGKSRGKGLLAINSIAVALTLILLFSEGLKPEAWSPYSRIRVYFFSGGPEKGFISTTNGNPQVGAMNFDIAYGGPEGALHHESRAIYELPYRYLGPKRVMVAGAGAGNEAEVAIRHGAKDVTAVELDPAFVELGRTLSPHRPFLDPKVRAVIDDARAFFHNTVPGYDLIVIGFLDSQYHLSHMSNIRTENFVYTVESLARTKALLAPGGVLQLNYNTSRQGMRVRLLRALKEAYGDEVRAFVPESPVSGNITFLAGPGARAIGPTPAGFVEARLEGYELASPPTDDWPYLYLEGARLPREYWPMLISIPIVSAVIIRGLGGVKTGFCPKYFLIGAGFMLLETKAITAFALFFGSTVTVVSVVLASIFLGILLANLVIQRCGLKGLRAPYILLFAALMGLYFLPHGWLLSLGWGGRLVTSVLLISAPLFFAALVFGISFSRSVDMGSDLGSNIFGCVIGGLVEYASMATGFSALYLLSLAFYGAAFVADIKKGALDG